MGSPRYRFYLSDLQKVAIGAVKPILLALAAYFLTVGPTIDQTTAGGLMLSTAMWIAADAIKKFYSDTRPANVVNRSR